MEGTSAASGKQLPYSRLRATVTDGRAANVFFRKNQLRRLNDELLGAKADLLKAITNDSGNTATEAWIEFYLTLSALKSYFDDLDPAQELQDEYRIAHGRDAADAREAVGIVYIQPDAHSYLYSVVVPIGAAIAAGNCVLVVIEQTLKVLPAVLQKLLQRSLDPDTLEIVQSQVEDTAFLSTCVQVIQTGTPRISNSTTLHSPRDAPVIGVVDRTADVEKAARDLVTARFSFGGRSPYAPDVVLVNEHVKTSFLNAAMRHSIRYLTEENVPLSGRMRKTEKKTSAASTQVDGIQVITSGSNGEILFVKDR
ncbi:hypothetical protein Sste5346_005987 [Sporothrix stenoceras]|uniref:Aldehyde dehydrogenase domain-containing protein n=1 Tax=Sporothrix stenoceras TaxID=5173 RepID=A0ABR3Z0P5_9PEZI